MEKLDLTKQYKSYFTAKTSPQIIMIEQAQFLSITGKGDPSGKDFVAKIEALYATAYTLKFNFKAKGNDFVVSKLEGLWWFDEEKYPNKNISNSATDIPRSEWEYRLLIRLPDYIRESDIFDAVATVIEKKNLTLAKEIVHHKMNEGKSVQMLHVGPFSTEPESLQKIGNFMTENKLGRNGLHHEIYLSDFRKTAPEKLKTILREPVK